MHPASVVVAAGMAVASCAQAPRPWPSPDATTYARLRGQLDERRETRPSRPWAAGIHVVLREPRSGRTVEGRGAIAVAPGRAVRMILLGGAGSTMLDAWVSQERYRVAIPALDRVRRGSEAEVADLPVGFLRWWFLAPLSGELFAAAQQTDDVWLLRTSEAVVELRTVTCRHGEGREGLLATRRAGPRAERVLECRRQAATPSVGDAAEYDDLVSGLHVRIDVESVTPMPPDEEAFRDPDATGGAP
jgi:hypothetical protein